MRMAKLPHLILMLLEPAEILAQEKGRCVAEFVGFNVLQD
jgi:hypothetical protein